MTTTHTPPAPYGHGHIKEMPALASRRDAQMLNYGKLQATTARAAANIQYAIDALPAGAIEARTWLRLTLADLNRAMEEATALTAR